MMGVIEIPGPESAADSERWEEGRRRSRMLESCWRSDLEKRLGLMFASSVQQRINSTTNMSRAPYKYACNALNTLLVDAPTVSAGDADLGPITPPTLWPLRHEQQLWTIGLGEALMRVDYADSPDGPGITYRPVPPHCVEALADPRDAYRLIWVRETMVVDGAFVRETHDSRMANEPFILEQWDPSTRSWVRQAPPMQGETAFTGYLDSRGNRLVPYQIYHYRVSHGLWHPTIWAELVDCQLMTGCLMTFKSAGMRDNAYPTRCAIDLDIPTGAVVPGELGPKEPAFIAIEPSTIVRFKTAAGATAGSLQTMPATMNIGEMQRAISVEVEEALQDAGLGPDDEAPAKGVSGTAITVSRESLRRSQKTQIPSARLSDQRLLALAAKISNAYGLTADLPENPAAYSISYHGIGLSTAEIASTVDRVTRLRDAKLMTQEMALIEAHPHLSTEDAKRLAAEINAETAARTPAPPMPAQIAEDPKDESEDPEDPEQIDG